MSESNPWKRASYLLPNFMRNLTKRLYLRVTRAANRRRYVSLRRGAYLGGRFRVSVGSGNTATVGARTNVEEYNIWDTSGGPIAIGSDVWIGLHNIVMGPVVIEDKVSTGPHVRILGPRHAVYGYDATHSKCTRIGRNAWISTAAIIMHGVEIGENAIVSPASVVTRDVAPNAIVAGNPARDITKMTSFGSQIGERRTQEPRNG